ncbi:MAG: cysteine desulfurase [Candidatus Obscuribacterales bacterium]|nr:cysteine desulfurase [Candidatus Obscuribacterales bacterium]
MDHRKPIFFDYLSTTPVDPRVVTAVAEAMTSLIGNASSVDHVLGTESGQAVEVARKQVSELVNGKRAKVVFTSGATESINLVVNHVVKRGERHRKAKLVCSPTEHAAVLESCEIAAESGLAEISYLKVDCQGRLCLESLRQAVGNDADLVCVMAANNEVGNIYPTEEVARLCTESGTALLCDASQAVGKIPVRFDEWGLTYLVLSSHKIYGPKGVGALISQRDSLPQAMFGGGHQEYGIRPGTINVPGIVGFGEAARLRAEEMTIDEPRIAALRDRLQHNLQQRIEALVVNGDQDARLSGSLHISIPGATNDAMIARLRDVLAISRGAACSSGIEQPSHVLTAMELQSELKDSALRLGIGKFTTDEEVDQCVSIISQAASEVRKALGWHALEDSIA